MVGCLLPLLKTLAAFIPIASAIMALTMSKSSENKFWYKLCWVLFGGISFVIILASQILADRDAQPRVDILYENSPEYIRAPHETERKIDGSWAIRVKVKTTQALRNACVALDELSSIGQPSIKIDVPARVGWYYGAGSWDCVDVYGDNKYFLLFIPKKDILKAFIVNQDGSQNLAPIFDDITRLPKGRYKIRLSIRASNLTNYPTKTFDVTWDGNISRRSDGSTVGFQMKPLDY